MTKKTYEVHILVGLPGSGKSTYANQFKDDRQTAILDLDKSMKRRGKTRDLTSIGNAVFWAIDDLGRNVFSYNLSHTYWTKLILDGLFLTNEEVIEAAEALSPHFHEYKLYIHQWNEDRETCEKNDEGRRDAASIGVIRNANYEEIDVKYIKDKLKKYPDIEVCSYIEKHTVELKPEWQRIYSGSVDIDGKLKSQTYCVGGVYGNCWDSSMTYTDGEEIKPFKELYDFLEEAFPNLLLKDWRRIEPEVVTMDRWDVPEYYGGHSSYVQWVCDIKKVYELMGIED